MMGGRIARVAHRLARTSLDRLFADGVVRQERDAAVPSPHSFPLPLPSFSRYAST